MTDLKKQAREIFREALASMDIAEAMQRKLDRTGSSLSIGGTAIDLRRFHRIRAVAMGKASFAMARGLAELLAPEYAVEGILVTPHIALRSAETVPGGFRAISAGHPVPDKGSAAAALAILDLLHSCDGDTLVFFLLSGGGSALVEMPVDSNISPADLQELHRLLIACGAPIDEINAVRKHFSAVKGGRLASAAGAATKVTLGISDVPVGRETTLASGPTLPDPTTVRDVRRVIDRYALGAKLPVSIRSKLTSGDTEMAETPKAGDAAFARSHFALLLDEHSLRHSAHRAAQARGFVTLCDNSADDWPVEKACDYLLEILARVARANPGRPVAVIAGGELSSPVTGDGIGGRNSAFVLDSVEKIAGSRFAVLSAGTDGIDGSSPAAGAVADGQTLARARDTGIDPRDFARRCDSYSFFRLLDDAVVTGPTGNNLRDLRILIAN